jgi:cyclase
VSTATSTLAARVIPCLLLKDGGLVKTVHFKNSRYVGDPINAVRIFNDKEVDELVILDIGATTEERQPPFETIADIATECFMPLAYGGGIRSIEDAQQLFALGVEKVIINSRAVEDPQLVTRLAERFGNQSIVVSVDVRRSLLGRYEVFTHSGRKASGLDPFKHAAEMELRGAGEILLNSIDRDGTMTGYDLDLIRRLSACVSLPVVACGGAADVQDLAQAIAHGASGAAAGSMFVFHGRHRAVLISYPDREQLQAVLQ